MNEYPDLSHFFNAIKSPTRRLVAAKKRSGGGAPDDSLNFPRKQNPRSENFSAVDFSAVGPPPARKQVRLSKENLALYAKGYPKYFL